MGANSVEICREWRLSIKFGLDQAYVACGLSFAVSSLGLQGAAHPCSGVQGQSPQSLNFQGILVIYHVSLCKPYYKGRSSPV